MSLVQDEIKIGLIGPQAAGKTSMFQTFHEALERGRHGFPRTTNLRIRRASEATPIKGLTRDDILDEVGLGARGSPFDDDTARVLGGDLPGTLPDQVVTQHYTLTYCSEMHGSEITLRLAITDAAGEHSFGKERNLDFVEYRRLLHRELTSCHGFVVVVPFSNAGDAGFVRQLESWLDALDKIAGAQEEADPSVLPGQRRLVVALTRYDVMFTDFGSDAVNLAADPAIATDMINRLVGVATSGDGYRRRIAGFDRSAGGRFDIAFVPTSTFGFVPGFGCANLDPDVDAHLTDFFKAGMSPGPFKVALPDYPGQYLFPFLTADPFIFAATGMDNPFIVPIDLAVRQVAYADRPTKLYQADSGVPPARDPHLPNSDSWRRSLARFLRRLDIEL
jgi:hypothetical protein